MRCLTKSFTLGMGLLALGIVSLQARPAQAQTLLSPGALVGFAADSVQPGVRGEASLNITTVQNGQFLGVAHISLDPVDRFDYQICLNLENTMISVYSLVTSGSRLTFHGRICPQGDGLPPLMALQYAVVEGDVVTHQGYLALLQRFGGLNWNRIGGAALTGLESGLWRSERTTHQETTRSRLANQIGTTAFTGILGLTTNDSLQETLQLLGTVSLVDSSGHAHVAALGLDPKKGIIAVLIGLLFPKPQTGSASLQGTYRHYDSLSSLYRDLVTRDTTSGPFDTGAWTSVVTLS